MTRSRAETLVWPLVGLLITACSDRADEVATPAAAVAPPAQVEASAQPPAGPLPDGVTPTRYVLDLTIDPRLDRFSGKVAIDIELATARERIWLHGLDLDVSEAAALDGDGERVDAEYAEELDSGIASLRFARPLGPGAATLALTYTAPLNRSVNALFRVDRGDDAYVASQLEAVAARQVFPGFDEPRFKTPWEISITARAQDVAVTNVPEIESTMHDGGWVRHDYAVTEPLPTYLLAFAVGPYDVVDAEPIPPTALRERPVPLRGIAARGLGSLFGAALADTPRVVTWLETYFNVPYPYPKLDLIAPPANFGGAMENPGAITYDEVLILLGKNPPLQQRRRYLYVHAHELAHMWFGDLVTPRWWTDIWLNESFATWMGNKAAQAVWPAGEFSRATLADALGAMAADSLASARRIREPVIRNEEIEDAFDGITYEKGGGVLGMFESFVGEEAFRAGVRLHMQRFAHGVADADDFMASLAEGSGQPGIAASFRSFIEQPGVPVVDARLECADDEVAPQITLRQRRYAPLGSTIAAQAQQWSIPVCIAYDVDGAPGRTCELLESKTGTIALDVDMCPTAIHPNSGGTGYYRFALDEPGWAALTSRASALEPAEALTLVDSMDAAFRAGELSAERLVAGLVALADHPAWDVVSATVAKFTGLLDVLPPDERPQVAPMLGVVYRPKLDALAETAGEQALLLRRTLLAFLALEVRDPEIRADLAASAARYVGIGGVADRAAIAPDLLPTALRVGVQDLGPTYFDRLVDLTAADEPYVRNTAFGALGRVEDPALAARLRNDILEQRFPLLDSLTLLFGQLNGDATRDASWDWVRANADAVIALVPEFFRSQTVPRFGSGFCAAERSAEIEAFVTAHASALPGYERSLEQTLEQVSLCTALRDARATDLIAALASLVR